MGIQHMLSDSPLPPGEGKIIGPTDRTVDAQPKRVGDISRVLLVEKRSNLLRSTGKMGQEPAIALTALAGAQGHCLPGLDQSTLSRDPGTWARMDSKHSHSSSDPILAVSPTASQVCFLAG